MRFCEKFLKIPEGRDAGKPLYLTESLEMFFYAVFDNPHGTRRAILSMARKNAKALALDTPIPTPSGFKNMGDVRVGDKVIGSDGKAIIVTGESEVFLEKDCYEVHFSDGSVIVASEDHLWETTSKWKPWVRLTYSNGRQRGKEGYNARPMKSVVTTKQIFESLLIPRNDGAVERNHSVRVVPGVHTEKILLPIEPYLLGVWLGDGSSRGCRITSGAKDLKSLSDNLKNRGHKFKIQKNNTAFSIAIESDKISDNKRKRIFPSALVELNLVDNKHIPEIYFSASYEDRMELLRGLLDTDGTVNRCGGKTTPRVSFCSISKSLSYDVWRLVRSCGFKAKIIQSNAVLEGVRHGISYKVEFSASKDERVFNFERKQNLLPSSLGKRSRTIQIVDCKPVGKVPCKCITVDSPDSLFLAGHGYIPTHNSTGIACILLCFLVGPEAKLNTQIVSGAMSRDQAALIYKLAAKMVNQSPELQSIVKEIPSKKTLIGLPLNVEFQALAADGATAQGLSVYLGLIDEAGQVRGPQSDFIDAITTSQGAHESPLIIYLSTQAPTDADFLSIMIDDATNSQDPHTVCHLYAAPDDCDLMDKDAWSMANPGLGLFRSEKDLEEQIKEAVRLPSKENSVRNLLLNQRISVSSPFVSRDVWQSNGDEPQPLKGKKVYGGLDLSAVSDLTGLVLVSEDGDVESRAWLPEVGIVEKSKSDRVPYDTWAKQGYITLTPGKAIRYEWVAKELRRVFDDYDVQKINFDRYNMKFLKPWLEQEGFTEEEIAKFGEFGQGFGSMSGALRSLESALLGKELKHGNNPVLTMCMGNCVVETDAAGNRKFTKKKSTGRIDLAVCLAMAEDARSKRETERSKEYKIFFV